MRYELTEAQWRRLEPLLPKQQRGGVWRDHRTVLNAILWIVSTGAPWRDLPERYGPWQTAYDRFTRWRKNGTWLKLLGELQAEFEERGQIDWADFFIDSTIVRASRAAAGAGKKGGAKSRQTTRSGVREVDSARKSTSSATHADTFSVSR